MGGETQKVGGRMWHGSRECEEREVLGLCWTPNGLGPVRCMVMKNLSFSEDDLASATDRQRLSRF